MKNRRQHQSIKQIINQHTSYMKNLLKDRRAIEYLKNRGFDDVCELIHRYKIGCSNDRKDYFYNYIVFPVFKNKKLVHMTGRFYKKANEFTIKHKHLPRDIEHFFNHDMIFKSDWLILVESPICAISLRQAGFPAIASLGQGKVCKNFKDIDSNQEIYILNDTERHKAGLQGAYKQAEILWDATRNIHIAQLPLPKSLDKIDVNDIFKISSKSVFVNVIEETLNDAEPYLRKKQLKKRKNKNLDADWKEKYDIIDVVKDHVDELFQQGNRYMGYCCFHDDSGTKSFVVYPNTNSWNCMHPDTNILNENYSYSQLGNAKIGQELVGIDEISQNNNRCFRKNIIENIKESTAECIKIYTDYGKYIHTLDHKFLVQMNGGKSAIWKDLQLKDRRFKLPQGIYGLFPAQKLIETEDYKAGYVKGYNEGNRSLRIKPNQIYNYSKDEPIYWNCVSIDLEGLNYIANFLNLNIVQHRTNEFINISKEYDTKNHCYKCETRSIDKIRQIQNILNRKESKEFIRGWLAGIFDSEGALGHSLVIYNFDQIILNKIIKYGKVLNFEFVKQKNKQGVRLKGDLCKKMEFLAAVKPKIIRKINYKNNFVGKRFQSKPNLIKINGIEYVGKQPIIEIKTSTKTFIADGLVSHNCFGNCSEPTGGDAANFIMKLLNCSFPDALKYLEEHYG